MTGHYGNESVQAFDCTPDNHHSSDIVYRRGRSTLLHCVPKNMSPHFRW